MKKLFSVFIFLLTTYRLPLTASSVDTSFSYGGSEFLMGSVCGEYSTGKMVGLGLDLYYFQQKIGETVDQKSYATSMHLIHNLGLTTFDLSLLAGFGISQSFYDDTKSKVSFSPNIGVSGEYVLSDKCSIIGKTIFLIYSDGFSAPYNLGLDYKLNEKVSLTAGISGKNDLITGESETFTTFKIGGMVGVRYGM